MEVMRQSDTCLNDSKNNKLCMSSASHSTMDTYDDAASSSDASTIYMNVEEMEDEEEEEQYFDVSDEVECDMAEKNFICSMKSVNKSEETDSVLLRNNDIQSSETRKLDSIGEAYDSSENNELITETSIMVTDLQSTVANDVNNLPSTSGNELKVEFEHTKLQNGNSSQIENNLKNVISHDTNSFLHLNKNVLKELNCDSSNIKYRQEEEKKIAMCSPCQVVLPVLNLDAIHNFVGSHSSYSKKKTHCSPAKKCKVPKSDGSSCQIESESVEYSTEAHSAFSSIFSQNEIFSLPFVYLKRVNVPKKSLAVSRSKETVLKELHSSVNMKDEVRYSGRLKNRSKNHTNIF